MLLSVKKLPGSSVEIEGELPADVFESYFARALRKLGEDFELDGFRKGKVPENILIPSVGEMRILEEMAELALGEHYPLIVAGEKGTEKIDAIGRPEISITKLARKNPLGFKIVTAVLPEIKLPDYKAIGKEIISLGRSPTGEAKIVIEVSDEEIEQTIMDIRKSRAPKKHMTESADVAVNEKKEIAGEELPEFNDEFVQALGPFTNVEDFKTKLKENIKLEKENLQKEKTRIKIIEKIITDSALEVPAILIEIELDKILFRMESDITAMGLKFEDYLKQLNKTVGDLRKEFRNDAEKKAKLGLILNEISKTEKISADEEEVASEVAHILEHYKDADPGRAKIHAANVLTNEKIFQFLENQ
jgi:FKBP-type peptidyl-prolyl cis-trans isomerase (trigger factor)